jgi:hypothetical protein
MIELSFEYEEKLIQNRMFVFFDASNLWEAQKVKRKFLDYQKVVQFLRKKFFATQIKCFFYTAYPAEGTRGYSLDGKHKFYTFELIQTKSHPPRRG